jgi:YHS domain-containing protein
VNNSPFEQLGQVAEAAKNTVAEAASSAESAAQSVRDPVCGKLARVGANRRLRFDYAGERYYFCSRTCLQRFAEQPEVFLSHPGEEGDKASFDRARRPEDFQHRGELRPGTPVRLEQPRVESGSG